MAQMHGLSHSAGVAACSVSANMQNGGNRCIELFKQLRQQVYQVAVWILHTFCNYFIVLVDMTMLGKSRQRHCVRGADMAAHADCDLSQQ